MMYGDVSLWLLLCYDTLMDFIDIELVVLCLDLLFFGGCYGLICFFKKSRAKLSKE